MRISSPQLPLLTLSSCFLHSCPEWYNLASGLLLMLHKQKLSWQALQPKAALTSRLHQVWSQQSNEEHGKGDFQTWDKDRLGLVREFGK